MQIQYIKIADLKPYDKNPRKNNPAVDKVAASIKEFGFQNPVIVDKDLEVVAGHTRLKAAKKLKLKEVPVIMVEDLTPEQIKAYRIADNKTSELAEWDNDLLVGELSDLQLSDYNLELTGFDLDEINKLMGNATGEAQEDDFDSEAAVAAIVEPITKRGDVYQLGRHRLMCGDSTAIDDVEKLMDGRKADMVFTDPPYGVDYKGINNDGRDGLEELLRGAFGCIYGTSKSGASCYVFHSDRCADIFHSVFREFFHFSSMIIWVKNSLTLSRTDYQSQHEPCLYGWIKDGTHTFYGDRRQTSIWEYDKQRIEGHTTPKPIGIISRALSNSSKSDDIIQDLFGGSGSTLIACEQLNRICYMMELDEKYCDVIIQRWETYTGQKAVRIDGEVGGS